MKIILIRHGEAEGNKENKIMSRRDVPLTESGQLQAHELVEKLTVYSVDKIYCSPQLRARDTIRPFAESKHVDVVIDDRLMEIDCGDFIGKDKESTISDYGKTLDQLLDSYDYDLSSHGGETSQEIQSRVQSFLDSLKQTDYSSIIVTTHDGIIRWLIYCLSGEKSTGVKNASIHEFNL